MQHPLLRPKVKLFPGYELDFDFDDCLEVYGLDLLPVQ